jgi:23S rRNA (uracil1939-C5)-methyltransferase
MPVVHISDLSWGGEGLGRMDGKVVFVPYSLPGEDVEIEVVHSKKNYCHGRIIRILAPSSDRIEPPCSFYRECGGCQLQHLTYHNQIQAKERLFKTALAHALPSQEILIYPTLRSPQAYGYRHRLLLKTAWEKTKFNLGFFKPKSHDLVNINHCLLANDPTNEILSLLGKKIENLGLTRWTPDIELQFFEKPDKGGIVFSSLIRFDHRIRKRISETLYSFFNWNYILFQERNDFPLVGEPPFSPEKDGLEFILPASETGLSQKIRLASFPQVFTQVNLEVNRLLIGRLLNMNLFNHQDTVLDLYCGFGNFTLPIALKVQKVIGIESFPWAIINARWNSKINGISNCSFIQARADVGLRRMKLPENRISLAIMDPPRTGAKEIIPLLNSLNLKAILYISCNPMTLLRDLSLFMEKGWIIQWCQPVDFFPQTFHLEIVACLTKATS